MFEAFAINSIRVRQRNKQTNTTITTYVEFLGACLASKMKENEYHMHLQSSIYFCIVRRGVKTP